MRDVSLDKYIYICNYGSTNLLFTVDTYAHFENKLRFYSNFPIEANFIIMLKYPHLFHFVKNLAAYFFTT